MLAIGVLVLALAQCEGIENAWFSVYGEPDHARPVSQGTDWGEQTKFGCSFKCGRDTGCSAFQFKLTNAPLGSCVVFGTLTLRRYMVYNPETYYYEKRKCEVDFPVDGSVIHFSDYHLTLFSGSKVRVYKYNIVRSAITSLSQIGDFPISDIYAGYATSVDAGFDFTGTSPRKIILLKGTKESCFQRTGSGAFTFSACPDTHYLSTFFGSSGLSRVDAITVYSSTNPDLHVTASDTIYHLRYSSSSGKFEIVQTYNMTVQSPSDPWYNAFEDIPVTALFRLTNTVVYIFEGSKYVKYDIVSKQYTSNPLIVCGN